MNQDSRSYHYNTIPHTIMVVSQITFWGISEEFSQIVSIITAKKEEIYLEAGGFSIEMSLWWKV